MIQAKGTLAAPTTVYQGSALLHPGPVSRNSQGDGAYGIPQTRAINPSLTLQFGDLVLLRAPKIAYNFTQTRDYVRNELRTPGALDLSTSLVPENLGSFFKELAGRGRDAVLARWIRTSPTTSASAA